MISPLDLDVAGGRGHPLFDSQARDGVRSVSESQQSDKLRGV